AARDGGHGGFRGRQRGREPLRGTARAGAAQRAAGRGRGAHALGLLRLDRRARRAGPGGRGLPARRRGLHAAHRAGHRARGLAHPAHHRTRARGRARGRGEDDPPHRAGHAGRRGLLQRPLARPRGRDLRGADDRRRAHDERRARARHRGRGRAPRRGRGRRARGRRPHRAVRRGGRGRRRLTGAHPGPEHVRPLPRRAHAAEYLDEPGHDPRGLEASRGHVAAVNRWLGGTRAVLRHVLPQLSPDRTTHILDVATGAADIPRAIVHAARRRNLTVRIAATDLHPQILDIARRRTAAYPEITVARADALALPYPDDAFDLALLSLALHHFEGEDQVRALRELARVSRGDIVV